jgi:hypothetical protein
MTRLLILGGSGMLRHRLWLAIRDHHDTGMTLEAQRLCCE